MVASSKILKYFHIHFLITVNSIVVVQRNAVVQFYVLCLALQREGNRFESAESHCDLARLKLSVRKETGNHLTHLDGMHRTHRAHHHSNFNHLIFARAALSTLSEVPGALDTEVTSAEKPSQLAFAVLFTRSYGPSIMYVTLFFANFDSLPLSHIPGPPKS